MTAITSRLKFLVLTAFIIIFSSAAQDNDYLKHGKIFNYCSLKHICAGCYTCENNRYEIKIKNNLDKKIKSIRYQVYSSVYNRVETKEAKIEGGVISNLQTGILYICVADIKHWAISEITYDDGSSSTFTVIGGLGKFNQEPDDCDCN